MSQDVDRPRLVVGHDLVLPNEQAARQTADRLAQRGHRWVLLEACTQPPFQDPRLAGWWQVWSLDEGPPYDTTTDLGWHQIAAEERALCTLARSLGGFYDTRTLVGGAEVGQELTLGIDSRLQPVNELDGPHTRARRAGTVPADVHDPSPPPAGPPLPGASMTPPAADSVELVGLDQVPWASLQASDIPWLLAELTEMHEAAYVGLLNELMPQGTCYPWTAPAIPFLGQLATSPAVPAHLRLWLLHALFATAMAPVSCIVLSSGRAAVLPGGVQENPENVAVWEAVGRLAPSLLARWEREPPVLRLLLAAIAAAFPATGKHHLAELRVFRDQQTGTRRHAYLKLVIALVTADDQAALAVAERIGRWEVETAERLVHTASPPTARALFVLEDVVERELKHIIEHEAGRSFG